MTKDRQNQILAQVFRQKTPAVDITEKKENNANDNPNPTTQQDLDQRQKQTGKKTQDNTTKNDIQDDIVEVENIEKKQKLNNVVDNSLTLANRFDALQEENKTDDGEIRQKKEILCWRHNWTITMEKLLTLNQNPVRMKKSNNKLRSCNTILMDRAPNKSQIKGFLTHSLIQRKKKLSRMILYSQQLLQQKREVGQQKRRRPLRQTLIVYNVCPLMEY